MGVRQAIILAVLVSLILGCAKDCDPDKEYREDEIVTSVETYGTDTYTEQEYRVTGENCTERRYFEGEESKFNLSVEDKEWVDTPVLGETNNLRRVALVYNGRDVIDTVYLDKVYLYDGKETKRSQEPMKFLVDPKSTRKLYVMWDTQYDPLKDVTVEFSNYTDGSVKIVRFCINETEKVDVTKTKKIVTGSNDEVTGYDKKLRVNLKRGC